MIRSFTIIILLFLTHLLVGQIDIADARTTALGETVTVEGIATHGGELGIIRYVQDATGGIAIYPGTGSVGDFPNDVNMGDLVRVTGELKEFNGLLEVDPISAYEVISSNNDLPEPLLINPSEVSEATEAILCSLEGVKFTAGGNTFSVGNYEFTANGESSEIYVRSNHPLIGVEIPLASVNLTGIGSQFNSIYQILPRSAEDIEVADEYFFTSPPVQDDIFPVGFTVNWTTSAPGTSVVKYGTSPEDLNTSISSDELSSVHSLIVPGDPATFYYVQACSVIDGTTISSAVQLFSTASNSSGDMKIIFNHNVDGTISNGSFADGYTGAAIEGEIIKRIDAAQTSIDASIYNINRATIVNALNDAYSRGVIVRYIADNETANLALADNAADFPVIRGNSEGLMHNKFFVFDASSESSAWIMSGSTNLTEQNIVDDYNNTFFIQDISLAKAYTIEFEEMWGSSDPSPGVFNVKFGPDKDNNTPHTFKVDDVIIESYFSPSDNTTIAIAKAIKSAESDLQFALLTFTNNELGDAVLDAHEAGVGVRGIVDNINDQGSEFDYLMGNGVNITDDNTTKSTHHKYAIIDASNIASDPQVVLGSHNWSGGAETRNDENTLIVHDADVANVYLQEFEARWCEVMGGGECTTGLLDTTIDGVEISLFPNPTSAFANVSIDLDQTSSVILNLLNSNGQLLESSIKQMAKGESLEQIDMTRFNAGVYYVQLKIGEKQIAKKITVVK